MKAYGFGVIGCGRISKNHLESIKKVPGARLVAVAESKEVILTNTVEKYHCQGYNDYQELLANSDVQIINICTESGLHSRIAIDAMKAGKHVLVEKPMAMSIAEADAMIATAKEMKVKIGVVHQNRFNNAILKLRSAIDTDKFGQLTHASAVLRWNRNDEYYSQAPWRGTWTQDGGCLMNQSIHNIDLLQWMMGPVDSLFAYTATNMRKIEGEDVGAVVLKFKSGALGIIEAATTIYPENLEETLNIFGSAGTVCIGGIAVNKIEAWRFDGENEAAALSEQDKEPPNVYGFGHADIIKDFMAAITHDREPAISGEEGRKALEIILAIYHSVKYKKEITFPLNEEFTIGLGLE
ncbi:Gfo/Idh/MocA family protein [Pelosinus propionicus]|uniref:Predicted dehydrogenase n=1 Tax=Pelosinus propionicus DSM 13327 TaxID=1123291 RepID=A0A1I4MPG3_9FIRM|nr:Gfo/Idh/MocA family oxidoreductase [Pelosinus propionicus]SFM05118.1 Predicted dehydrogenase [Pelosinus propionicus DSM 13327]